MTSATSGTPISFFIEPRDVFGNRCEAGSNAQGTAGGYIILPSSFTLHNNNSYTVAAALCISRVVGLSDLTLLFF